MRPLPAATASTRFQVVDTAVTAVDLSAITFTQIEIIDLDGGAPRRASP